MRNGEGGGRGRREREEGQGGGTGRREREEGEGGGRGRRERGIVQEEGEREDLQITYNLHVHVEAVQILFS